MKSKYFLASLLCLMVLSFASVANAQTYSLGVSSGDSFEYKITTLKDSKLWGEAGSQEGDTFTYEIASISETTYFGMEVWELTIDVSDVDGDTAETSHYV